MSRRYSESARLLEFALDMGQRVLGSVSEMLPDEAKQHLIKAQREVVQALVIVYEQQAGTRRESRRRAPDEDEDVVVRSPRGRRPPADSAKVGRAAPARSRAAKVDPVPARRPRGIKIDVE